MGPNPREMTDAEVIDASLVDPQRFATIFDPHVAGTVEVTIRAVPR